MLMLKPVLISGTPVALNASPEDSAKMMTTPHNHQHLLPSPSELLIARVEATEVAMG
jgi:hypothetical protein